MKKFVTSAAVAALFVYVFLTCVMIAIVAGLIQFLAWLF